MSDEETKQEPEINQEQQAATEPQAGQETQANPEPEASQETQTSPEPEASQETQTSAGKPVKVPGVFKKPVKKRRFEKRFLKFIEHPNDRNYFKSCFNETDDAYLIRENLSKNDVKRIKGLLKVIKANKRGSVKIVPLFLTAGAAAAIVVFFTIFANPLLEKAMELGLEAIFEARSDVHGLRLSLVPLRFSMRGVTVANRDSPMTNLFEIGRMDIRLRTQAILRGKVYIEEIRADTIRFGTPRSFSGALPGVAARERQQKQKNNAPPMVDFSNFDATALLEREYDKLTSPKLFDEAINTYNETAEKWERQFASAQSRVEELQSAAQPLLSLDINSLNNLDTVRRTIQDVTTMVSATQNAINEATTIVNGIESDINTARQLETNARNAINDDINHLRAYIDPGSGAAFAALEPSIREVLSGAAEQYLDYGLIALDTLQRLKALADAQPKTEKPKKVPRFRGRDVAFPVAAYPAFYLGVMASDFTIDSWNWSFDLRDISSNPDMTNRPVTLKLGLRESGGSLNRQVAFNGSADFRSAASEQFNANIVGGGFPVSLDKEFSDIGINGFTGESDFTFGLIGQTNGAFSGGGDLNITKPEILDPSGTIAEAAGAAVREAGRINLGISYAHNIGQADEFGITSNIADILARTLRNTVNLYARQAMAEAERVLRERIDEYVEGRFGAKDELDVLLRSARGDKDAINQIVGNLDSVKAQLERKLRDAAGEAIQNILPRWF